MQSSYLKLVDWAYYREYNADSPRKNDNRYDPDPSSCGMNGKPVCEDGQTGNHGVQVGYRAVF